MGELLSLLRFNAGSGHIWLDEQRMLLLHARAFAELRKELLDSLGVERARGLLVRMGFASALSTAIQPVTLRPENTSSTVS